MTARSAFRYLRPGALVTARDGSTSLGGALVIALALVPMTVGIVDIGRYAQTYLGLEDAVQAAMRSALATDGDVDAVETSVEESGVPDVAVALSESCLCPTTPVPVSCSTTCPPVIEGGAQVDPVRNLRITVTRPYTPIFAYPYIPDSVTLKSEAVVQVNGSGS